MELLDRFETIEHAPAVYAPGLDAVVIADLHLGLESLLAREGTYMPKFQTDEIVDEVAALLEATGAETLVVCGDIKHEFSETTYGEREEVRSFLDRVTPLCAEIVFIKGNHDNYLHYAIEDYDAVRLEERLVRDGVLFVHGHERVADLAALDADCLVMGHEHPALTLEDEVGVAEKLPCFLYGSMDDGRDILVLPAFSPLAEGSQINQVPTRELLSPILREDVDISTLQAVGVDREAGLFPFPALGQLRG